MIKIAGLAEDISTDVMAKSFTISENELIQCEYGSIPLYTDDLYKIAGLFDVDVSCLLSIYNL